MGGKDHFPILGIQEFQDRQRPDPDFLYHELQGERHIGKPHKHDFFIFLLFEKGKGTHAIDFTDYPIRGRQIHLLFPGQVHKWHIGKGTSGFQLMISRPVFEAMSVTVPFSYLQYRHHPVLDLGAETFGKLLYEFQAIEQELSADPMQWEIVNLRSRIIAQLVSREAERAFEDMVVYRSRPVLLRFHSLIDNHYKDQKSVAFYAGKLNISANYLNILCRKYLNVPASHLIQSKVTLEAKRLLLASDKTIKEIAFDLGFYDTAYFSNFFKNQTSVSPRGFREQL